MRWPLNIIRDVMAEYDDEHGKGAARLDLAVCAVLAGILMADAYGIAAVLPAIMKAAGQ